MYNYRAIVHYYFKKGSEEKGLKFLEKELLKNAQQYGCHHIELLQNEKDHSLIVGIAEWSSLADAQRFQSLWTEKEQELYKYCTAHPKREFFKIKSSYFEKTKKVA